MWKWFGWVDPDPDRLPLIGTSFSWNLQVTLHPGLFFGFITWATGRRG